MNFSCRRWLRWLSLRLRIVYAVLVIGTQIAIAAEPARGPTSPNWSLQRSWPAPEATQAAAADREFLYAINNTSVSKYRRSTGERVAVSRGSASHLNSGFFWRDHLYCAHSNYPVKPEHSEIKRLNVETMELNTFQDFGASDGSLTWVLYRDESWWCHFAYYGVDNRKSYLVQYDGEWQPVGRWTLPAALVDQLGRYSLSGGVWDGNDLLVTGHDDPVAFRLRLPATGKTLEYGGSESIPFTGQGIAIDPVTNGLVGIHRAQRQLRLAKRPTPEPLP